MLELVKREDANVVCFEVKYPSLAAAGKLRWTSQGYIWRGWLPW